jgi:preprotein translocase subunit SecG
MTVIYYLLLFLFLFACVFLCFFILIQESKSTGLGASFGGEGGESLFGTSTPDILKKISAYLAVAFFLGCLILSFWTASLSHIRSRQATEQSELIQP